MWLLHRALVPHLVRDPALLTQNGCRFYEMHEGTESWENKTINETPGFCPCRAADSPRRTANLDAYLFISRTEAGWTGQCQKREMQGEGSGPEC